MIPGVVALPIYSSNSQFASTSTQLVIIAPANDGPVNVPTPLAQIEQAKSIFAGGQLLELAAKAIKSKRFRVLAVRAASTAVSSFSAVSRTVGHGTSVVTLDGASATDVNALVELLVHTGGTIGTAGITYQLSIDGGRTFAATAALGTATTLQVALGSVHATLDFASGTLVAGELVQFTASVLAAGTFATLDESKYPLGTNTADASIDTATHPDNDYEIVVEFLQGGALGTAGISYRVSTSAGRNDAQWSQALSLGTDLGIVIPGTGGVRIVLGTAAQTIGTGAVFRLRTYAPNVNAGSVIDALEAVFKNRTSWEWVVFGGALDASMLLAIDEVFAANYATTLNGEKQWVGNARMPTDGETATAYYAAMQTLSNAARSCYFGTVCYGDCKVISAVDGYLHRRPVVTVAGQELASVAPHIDIARNDRPGLACLLADENGNPECHDEETFAGPDDLGFLTLRQDVNGVYVTNPRIFSPAGSKIEYAQHRQLANLHTRIARGFLRYVCSVGIVAGPDGRIRESEALRIEKEANALEDALRKQGWISEQSITVSRTDDLANSTPATLNVSGEFVPLLYPKRINYTEQMVATISNRQG